MKRFSEFVRGIYETCHRNFFNLEISLIAQLYYFYVLLEKLAKNCEKLYDTRASKFFLPQCDLMRYQILNLKLCSKITSYHKNYQHLNATL